MKMGILSAIYYQGNLKHCVALVKYVVSQQYGKNFL